MVQVYTGITSHLTEAFPMKSENQIPSTIQEFFRKRGAPNNLKSDNAKAVYGETMQEILCQYHIGIKYSEPHQQNQNQCERKIQDIKADVRRCMDRTGTPAKFWLLCLLYTVFLHNHLSHPSLDGKTPLHVALGSKPDISCLLTYHWWQPVYYLDDDGGFPSESREKRGRWVGVAENIGDTLTYYILTDDTQQVIARSVLRPVTNKDKNLRADNPSHIDGELDSPDSSDIDLSHNSDSPSFQLQSFTQESGQPVMVLPRFSPEELMKRTFIYPTDDGQKLRAKIIQKINDADADNHQNIKFLCQVGDEGAEEIIAYTEICQLIEEQDRADATDKLHTYQKIVDHHGPLKPSDPSYKSCLYNVKVLWEDGTETWEPFSGIKSDDPITLATYALENDLLHLPLWKNLRKYTKNKKKYQRLVNQAMMKSERRSPIFMFGVQVPRNHPEALMLDEKNGNTKWQDSEKKELDQLNEYKTFIDKGIGYRPGKEYTKIRVHFVYAVKHDLRHKARLVAGGHMTVVERESSYSGVVSLRSIRLALVMGELNGLQAMVGDVGNAYLEAETQEKVFFIAGPEFGDLQGHTMIIFKALYGLRSSGARYHETMATTLSDMGFKPTLADPDLWIRDKGDHYEYVCVYVDDLMMISKNPQEFFDSLVNKYKYILKGVGPPSYHLGGDFGRDPDGTLYWGAQRYIEKLMFNYERMFGCLPNKYNSPLNPNDSPELDTSELLDEMGIKMFQSMIGALQWCVTLGRFDIAVAVMSLSSFRAAPREGHLKRAQHIYGYLRNHNKAAIRFRTGLPDLSGFSMPEHDWMYSVYGDECKEEIPDFLPTPKGKKVRTFAFVDANLYHCKVTGKAATGILHFINQTPCDWYSKKQPTVETATYGSEFVAARTATEQIMDLRFTLRSMGAPIEEFSYLLGDNQSVITSSTIPHSLLSKRHNALAYHRVRAAVAGGFLKFCYLPSKQNTADILTKFLNGQELYQQIHRLLFWKGDTKPN